jgi:hypothetical protein
MEKRAYGALEYTEGLEHPYSLVGGGVNQMGVVVLLEGQFPKVKCEAYWNGST